MYNISIDDDSVVVECRYLRHRRRRHYLRRCFYARTCVRDQCARSFLFSSDFHDDFSVDEIAVMIVYDTLFEARHSML